MAFQSPFHRGNGCYRVLILLQSVSLSLSVPFSSGQWLLQYTKRIVGELINLSVPFSSGQWLLRYCAHLYILLIPIFQSPFHRGNGCYFCMMIHEFGLERILSVPFSSGQWLLLYVSTSTKSGILSFSPLFIGAMVATYISVKPCPIAILSVPFSSGIK